MEHLRHGKYIGSAEHKQNLLLGMRDIAEILKIVTLWNMRNANTPVDYSDLKEGYAELKKQLYKIK